MEQKKRWQLGLIIGVILLTVYNILPTLFFYTKPLKSPVTHERAETISTAIAERVNHLETDAVEWIGSFNKLLGIKAKSVTVDQDNPSLIHISFEKESDVQAFRHHLPRAGALIPFVPAQLTLQQGMPFGTSVTVHRSIPMRFDTKALDTYFSYAHKKNTDGTATPLYKKVTDDRLSELALATGGASENARLTKTILTNNKNPRNEELITHLAQNINTYAKTFGENSPMAKRFYATVTQGDFANKTTTVKDLLTMMNALKDKARLERIDLTEKSKKLKKDGNYLELAEQQRLEFVQASEEKLAMATRLLQKHEAAFASGAKPWNRDTVKEALKGSTLNVAKQSPVISGITVDWASQNVAIHLHPTLVELKKAYETNPSQRDALDQLIFNEIARISRESGEQILPHQAGYQIALNALTDSQSVLVMHLDALAEQQAIQVKELISKEWHPTSTDLTRENFPVMDYATYRTLPAKDRKLGLVVYTPTTTDETPPQEFRKGSVFVIAKGLEQILHKYQTQPDSPQAKEFYEDFTALRDLLKQNNFFGYPGSTHPHSIHAKDFIFEAEDAYQSILKATREDFKTYGTKKYAILEMSNVEQRILATNKIEDQIHEDLLKWKDEFNAAQVDPNPAKKLEVPHPTKSPLAQNFMLSLRKYFRGDDRKILHWGLDLSGGKTVQIELRDNNNRIVKNEADIKQGINELYSRVNKMGVSEVNIRQEGSNITLDFPGAQGLSAQELVKASTMQFHVVNEKFTGDNPNLADSANRFLQDVWNEAVVTNRKDIDSLNLIAWNHLYGEGQGATSAQPRSESAKTLLEAGLKLAHPHNTEQNSTYNDSLSKLAIYRGDTYTDWHGQSHPLLVVFNNFAIEGSNLENIHSGYDPAKGNYLSFGVKGSMALSDGQKINPRAELHNWTSTFSKEKVLGTPLETYSSGRGWRMAVVLNGSIINAPTLDSPLREGGMISGNFTQREVNKLEADLKAGSLSFAPRILSEKNVSAELGSKERHLGILATVIALLFVMGLMTAYYRFAGMVASIAVVFNLLIMWAALQNIHATMSLAGIAGIILTMGMAVDANVLVFERIREEFAATGKIALAVQAGYKRAFSAILDSNITTIMAAIILLNFDSGPIKGLALTLVIGIASSMFTALFMTRYFFTKWVENPKHNELKMSNWIKASKFNFLKYGKVAFGLAAAIVLAGGVFFSKYKDHLLGLDFTGGFVTTVELQTKGNTDYRTAVEKALVAAGASAQDIQVRELTPSNHVKIVFGRVMEKAGKPFAGLPLETLEPGVTYAYQNNPRLDWAVNALEKSGLTLTPMAKQNLAQNWSNISGQMSDAMRNNALLGLGIALLSIFFYIAIRFEYKYALSATLALVHDVLVVLGLTALLNRIGVPVQIDMNTIAALMTIVGYSLNDTIVIFDRIREDVKGVKKQTFYDLINNALNVTLSRTVMTSATTFVVLLALVILGGSTVFGFALVMSLGVIVGTLSSLFVASPLMYFFHKREEKREVPTLKNGAAKS